MAEPNIATRRWFRFSLRTLLIATLAASALIGWFTNERRQSAHEYEIAMKLTEQGWKPIWGGPWDTRDYYQLQSWWRRGARWALGDRIVTIDGCQGFNAMNWWSRHSSTSGDLTPFDTLPHLRSLNARHEPVVDLTPLIKHKQLAYLHLEATKVVDLSPLTELKALDALEIQRTNVSDLRPLQDLKQLTWLNISETKVSDLTPLAGLTNLQRLILQKTLVPKEQIESLKKALPNCRFVEDNVVVN